MLEKFTCAYSLILYMAGMAKQVSIFQFFWPSPAPPHWRIQKYLLQPTLPKKPSPGAYPEIYIFSLNLPSHPSKVAYPEAKKGRNPP